MSHPSPGQFFLVGCPRSGTTLLQSLLASHSQIISFPESRLFIKVFPQLKQDWKLWLRRGTTKMSEYRLQQFLRKVDYEERIATLPPLPWSQQQYGHLIITVMNELMRAQNKQVWLEKTPDHLHFIPQIQRLIPNAKFIHILRNGTDTVASLYEVRLKYPEQWRMEKADIHRSCDRWLKDIALSYRYRQHPRHRFVRYEHLIANTAVVVQDLCRFIGVTYEPQMLENYRHTVQNLVLEQEAWKANVTQAIESTQAIKFKKLFSVEEQAQIRERLLKGAISTLDLRFTNLWQS